MACPGAPNVEVPDQVQYRGGSVLGIERGTPSWIPPRRALGAFPGLVGRAGPCGLASSSGYSIREPAAGILCYVPLRSAQGLTLPDDEDEEVGEKAEEE